MAMYRLNQLVEKGFVQFEDYLAKHAFNIAYGRLYRDHFDQNFVVKTRYKNDKHEQAKLEKEATVIYNKVSMACRELQGQPVSDELIKHMRIGVEKWVMPELHCSKLSVEKEIDDSVHSLISQLLIHHDNVQHGCLTDNHYVVREDEKWSNDMKFSGEATGCGDGICTIL